MISRGARREKSHESHSAHPRKQMLKDSMMLALTGQRRLRGKRRASHSPPCSEQYKSRDGNSQGKMGWKKLFDQNVPCLCAMCNADT